MVLQLKIGCLSIGRAPTIQYHLQKGNRLRPLMISIISRLILSLFTKLNYTPIELHQHLFMFI